MARRYFYVTYSTKHENGYFHCESSNYPSLNELRSEAVVHLETMVSYTAVLITNIIELSPKDRHDFLRR